MLDWTTNMKIYKPNVAFHLASGKIEKRLSINDNADFIFINYGKKLGRNKNGFAGEDGHSFTLVEDGIIYEIVIEALTDNDAEEVVDLLNSCSALIQGAPSFELDQLITNIHYIPGEISLDLRAYFLDNSDALFIACKMVKKAINDNSLKTSVLKFGVAHEIFYLHPMDLHPSRDSYDYQYLLSRQIKMGYAIIVCYSILEEMNLHVKASKDKPSVVDGKRNEEVIIDLQGRLCAKGIDPNQKIPWLSRSTQERPFKNQTNDLILCEWSDGQEIRDFEINITDAIFETSYIRSKIASHGNSEKVSELSLYDVENTNMLVRRVLCSMLL
jgi:hypothetical protein